MTYIQILSSEKHPCYVKPRTASRSLLTYTLGSSGGRSMASSCLPAHLQGRCQGLAQSQRVCRASAFSCRRVRRGALMVAAASSEARRVVCLGEALFDFLANEKGVSKDKVKSWTPYPGGAPCNVATCLSHLGVPTLFVGALGKDDRGEELMALMKERGVDTSGVQRTEAPTRDVYVERSLENDRNFAGFGRSTDSYCDCYLDPKQLPVDAIKAAEVLVTGTLGLAYPTTKAAMHAAAAAAKAGKTAVMVDVNWRPVFWQDLSVAKDTIGAFLENADIIKISDADLEYLYGISLTTALLNPCSVAEKLPSSRAVLVTAGDEGAAYCFRSTKGEHSGFVPVFKVEVADTTGAGDAFTAGFLYKLLEVGSLERLAADPLKVKEAIVFASATGALTCTKPGAIGGQPTLEEVKQLYEESKKWYNFWGSATEAPAGEA